VEYDEGGGTNVLISDLYNVSHKVIFKCHLSIYTCNWPIDCIPALMICGVTLHIVIGGPGPPCWHCGGGAPSPTPLLTYAVSKMATAWGSKRSMQSGGGGGGAFLDW
jgi:hypothetical protein